MTPHQKKVVQAGIVTLLQILLIPVMLYIVLKVFHLIFD